MITDEAGRVIYDVINCKGDQIGWTAAPSEKVAVEYAVKVLKLYDIDHIHPRGVAVCARCCEIADEFREWLH